jgi:hypothetical protein
VRFYKRLFRTRYQIVTDRTRLQSIEYTLSGKVVYVPNDYFTKVYIVQFRRWWWTHWEDCNTHASMSSALRTLNYLRRYKA